MDSPTQRHVEVVYDRFLMATSRVKRVSKGYQSCNVKPVSMGTPSSSPSSRSPGKFFHSSRRPMPPPVSSEDRRFAGSSVDELGRIQPGSVDADTSGLREDRAGAARVVSRAFKAQKSITHAWLTNFKANISCPLVAIHPRFLSLFPIFISLSLRPFIPCISLFSSVVHSHHDTARITLFTISSQSISDFFFLSTRLPAPSPVSP